MKPTEHQLEDFFCCFVAIQQVSIHCTRSKHVSHHLGTHQQMDKMSRKDETIDENGDKQISYFTCSFFHFSRSDSIAFLAMTQ